jgi:amino acid adenylation domain-containing protein
MSESRDFTNAGLDADQLELLEYLLEEEGLADTAADVISPRSHDGPAPLSFAQRRLWFLDQLEPGTAAYNIAGALRIVGQLDVPALDRSLNEIVRRHESLRTSFVLVEGEPTQIIAPLTRFKLSVEDLSANARAEREAEQQRLLKEEVRQPFDLSQGPLIRARLLRLRADEYLLLLTMHHIISDGWSIGNITRELAVLYGAFRQGKASPLEELRIQYADYAAWQHDHLSGEVLERELSYWKQQLSGTLPVLELPTKRARSNELTARAAMQTFHLTSRLSEQVNELARAEDSTLFMVLLAAFNLLLWRYSGQTDILVGSPIANRNRNETEPLIGFFVNTLVLRTRLDRALTFRVLLKDVKESCLGAYAHQEAPFEKLVEELQPERSVSTTPLVRVMFVLQNAAMPAIELPGLQLTLIEADNGFAKFDLMLEMVETPDGLQGLWQYNTDLFDEVLVSRIAANFQTLLDGIVANPAARLADLPFLTRHELNRLLVEWNSTANDYPREACVHELFERQVERTPDAVALIFEGERLTYRELNQRANQLAHHLISLGVGPDVCVGIAMERSLEMVIALLSIMKAGGAYVPLDSAHPADRLAYMLHDARLTLLLSQESLRETLPEHQARVLWLDNDWRRWENESTANPASGVNPENLIYVIYTSGTTGMPKGVAVHHQGIVNCILSAKAAAPVHAQDRLLFKASLNFDPSVWELFTALLKGASVVVARPGGQRDATYIAEATIAEGITILHFVPSMLALFLEEPALAEITSLRWVVCGGEAMPVQTMERFHARLSAPLQNFYGPTETSIGSTLWLCDPARVQAVVPIGRPISNTQTYVLDPDGAPTPIGVPGELYIGGEGVARGYLNRPDLTADKFHPDPFGGKPGARMYRTGDLVRYLPDGDLEFLGRTDHQVKIRGFRIELEEVEAVLGECPGVREPMVMVREDVPGDKRLVAYFISATDSPPKAEELRTQLRDKLPEYMVPSAFVPLAEFPLMVNGKIDRHKLPLPDQSTQVRGGPYVEPRTPTEEKLAEIVGDVLGVEKVGVYDNFFELGGHSLLATQVVTRVRETFQVNLQLKKFFDGPVIAELAPLLDSLRHVAATPMVPIAAAARNQGLPLSFAQQRLWFLDQLDPGNPIYSIPSAVRLQGQLDPRALERTLNEIVRRHESLRTVFREQQGVAVQFIEPERRLALPLLSLAGFAEADQKLEVERLATVEARKAFDLARGPLLRARLLRLGPEDHVLLFTLHHIISDGWSVGILMSEAKAIYAAYTENQESPLPELTVQYADYAVWQRGWLKGEVVEQHLAYWKRQLNQMPPFLELPGDRPRPREMSFRGSTLNVGLSKVLTEELRALSQREGVTLYMVLLAAFQTLLYRYTGQTDIVVGSPIANRQNSEIEQLIGFFVNTLVLRVDLSGDPSFKELLERVQEVTLDAYEHQDIPFEMLVEELQPERNLSFAPLFQILFVLQNAPRDELTLAGLELSHMDVSNGATHFDLTLQLEESAEGMVGVIEYSLDLFDEETMKDLFGHLQTLLAAIVENPDERISALPLLTETEKHRLLVQWNETAVGANAEQCVQDLVAEQASRTPDYPALCFGDTELSYQDFNQRANRLAHHLQTLGVGPDAVVAIMMERSIEMMVSILAVLKAGGAYTALDPADTGERLAFRIKDAKVKVVITQQRLAARLPLAGVRVFRIDSDWPDRELNEPDDPVSRATADNLAYLTYTSGSTGQPKAVAMHHRPLLNLIKFQIASSNGNARLRTLQFASLSFDVSFQEIFSTWCAGGTLVLIGDETRKDSRELWHAVAGLNIERLFLPFVALQSLAEVAAADAVEPRGLRQIITAGEQLKITDEMRALFGRLPQCTLDNHYGPSETHLATWLRLEGPAHDWPRLPAIGRPIANAQAFVLDTKLQPVPVGVVGELFIGGAGLARGYLNRPDQTAWRFIPGPFNASPGARFYRTGDLVRHLKDGRLEFVGRSDNQVKVRGFRIEVGEIESALKQHPAVSQVAVVATADEDGDKRLVAYVVAGKKRTPSSEELRNHLRAKLPEYMVPAVFLTLDRLPLSRSGKVNRHALPAVAKARVSDLDGYVAPRTPIEEILTGIWAEVLKVDRVGVHDNFFDLGGHSLLATQLMSRVRTAFELEVSLRSLFDGPTVGDLAQRIEATLRSGNKQEVSPISARATGDQLPLSFAQQRLWFIEQLQPESSTYHICAALRMAGQLNSRALELSLAEILRRHEVLRTSFITVDGEPVQVIAPHSAFALHTIDLATTPVAERDAELQRLMKEEALKPFNLTESPLLRARLLRLNSAEHVLQLTMHHIVSDGWSSGIIVKELTALYQAFNAGEPSPLEELAIQYGDYALWQRERLGGQLLGEQIGYWKEQLARAPTTLELPRRQLRSVVQAFRGTTEEFELSPDLSARLKTLSRNLESTLFMTLLAAFKVLLWRYSGQTDILVGSPIANRNRVETESLIGFFVNTLVLRTELSPDLSFRELLKRVREVCLGAYAHQEVPFEKLVEELQPVRSLSHTPLVQVMFALQNAPMPALSLSGLQLSLMEVPIETAKFDLTFSLEESFKGLSGVLEYNSDLFDAGAARRMLGQYGRLLEAIASDPEVRLSELPLLTEAERRQILDEWNDTAVVNDSSKCAHEVFAEQVKLTPDTPAVVTETERLTFAELNLRANQLANYLRSLGVGPEKRVCICIERSVDLLVSILATAKAGGAYVPLDPLYPAERLSFMVADSSAEVLLTRAGLLEKFSPGHARIVAVDTERELIAAQKPEPPASGVLPDNLAYVIYTSGSTGQPKGVQITHASLMNLVRWYQRSSGLIPGDRATFTSGIGFDASVMELWPNLTAGVGLYLPNEETRLSPAKLRDWLVARQITVGFLSTPLVELVLGLDWPSPTSLRVMHTGGDKLHDFPKDDLPFKLINDYGPTENTVIATSGEVQPQDRLTRQSPSIGRPVDNIQVYVLDQALQLVPTEVPGELCVGGASLARGYVNQPDLTAERFIPNPFSTVPGERLYRTGDRVRYLANGEIEFMGRQDHQIKIRGHRIELGEIEAVINQYPAVAESVVVCHEDERSEKRLIAYLVPVEPAELSLDGLRAFLLARVPDYMAPGAFVVLESLPLNANGKVDREALPAPDASYLPLHGYVAPRTELERTISSLWQEFLGLEKVGIHDNFFDMGGHSLLMIRMQSRLQQSLHREIPIIELFRYPTVRSLALYLSVEKPGSQDLSPHKTRAAARRDSIHERARRSQQSASAGIVPRSN